MNQHQHLTVVRHPLVQHKLALIREQSTPPSLFRQLLHEISLLLAYEVTRDLPATPCRVATPLATIDAPMLAKPAPALISILRAGNGLLDGALELIPSAAVGFIGLQRDEHTLEAIHYYCKLPPQLEERVCIVLDPMLATGNSSSTAVTMLKEHGARRIRFLCLLAAPEGVDHLRLDHPDVPIVTAALDERLDDRGFIVPGLGDAGDRLFATG